MENYEVIIIGGSYSGLSAAMALGRASRRTLIIDAGEPCNRQTPHSHNFITHDGEVPAVISAKAKEQVLAYPTVTFINDKALKSVKTDKGFIISTESGSTYESQKLLIASGVKDVMPPIEGFAECWGISVIHCPYCHGYEVKNQKTALMANGPIAEHFLPLLLQWTKDLTLFTNAKSTVSDEITAKFRKHNIPVIEAEIESVQHTKGYMESITLKDGTVHSFKAMYAKIPAVQHTFITEDLGVNLNEQGLIEVDEFKRTNISGVYASGDCTSMGRAVIMAAEAGTRAGVTINNDLCAEAFESLHF
ncbi:MAG: pyridine nucleotide-disulfide oxidoreductase [Flavobacterium psychrophilum]|nr:MAG: pyridine nucleotide-disulfide oxidoreductase [Flavobacterium psychrophilum]